MIVPPAIDFCINELSTENRLRSQRTPNYCKSIDLRLSRFPNVLRNSTIYFRMFLSLVTYVSWESRFRYYGHGYNLYQRYIFQFIPILLVKEDDIVLPCNKHSNETMTQLIPHVVYPTWVSLTIIFILNYLDLTDAPRGISNNTRGHILKIIY